MSGSGKGVHTTTSGIEAWKPNPTTWDNGYFRTCSSATSVATPRSAGAKHGWRRTSPEHLIPDAHDPSKKSADDDLFTADLS